MGSTEFTCSCGQPFLNSIDNRSYLARFVADQDYDAFFDLVDAAVEKSGPTPLDKERAVMELRASLFPRHSRIWQCSKCGLVFITDANGNRHAYTPVDDAPRDLLSGRGVELQRVRHRDDPA